VTTVKANPVELGYSTTAQQVQNPLVHAFNRRSHLRIAGLAALCVVCLCAAVIAREPAAALSDTEIDAALRMASDESAAAAFLNTYRLQAHSGTDRGPMLGWLSTPFSRTVLAGLAARKGGQTIGRHDIAADPFFSEFVVIATPQPAADSRAVANITEIAVETRVGTEVTDTLLPMRMRPATVLEQKLHGMESVADAVVAVFSLDAVAPMFEGRDPHVVVRVTFDKAAKGPTPLTACKDCLVSISDR
jgi:hypothetical protein